MDEDPTNVTPELTETIKGVGFCTPPPNEDRDEPSQED